MKCVVLFVGLLSLLFFNGKGYTANEVEHPTSGYSAQCCFDSGRTESIWGFEKTETCQCSISDQKITPDKRRFFESFQNLLKISSRKFSVFSFLKPAACLQISLFLFYQYSQSLWEVFLDWQFNFYPARRVHSSYSTNSILFNQGR